MFLIFTIGCSLRLRGNRTMKPRLLLAILAAGFLLLGCKKSSDEVQFYRSVNGRTSLRLISRDECELSDGSAILLGKYTRQPDALRVVLTTMGTNQVIYYRITDRGIQDNDGNMLLLPDRYAVAVEQARVAREAEEARQRALQEEQARQRLAERQALEQRQERDRIEREKKEEVESAIAKGTAAFKQRSYREGIAAFERASKLGSGAALNNLAWHYATCPDSMRLDGKKAVEFALQATKMEPNNANWLDTLAAAYARDGQFMEARSTQDRALKLRSGPDPQGLARFKLYIQEKAYQEPN
ncbi:hypothetical protein [Prosthecobacter sp.]|uniref:hypothetical protein n=1 Tax=Prosthecobacter sp. TaxID=1965333 RepID=UPI003784181E